MPTDPSDASTADGCLACPRLAVADPPPRERVVATRYWSVAHSFNAALEGWLVALPRRHVTAIHDLSTEEAAELGPLLVALSRALRDVVGCEKTYVLQLAESEGFHHVHFHVVPRDAQLPDEHRGPRVLALLGRTEEETVAASRRDELALAVRGHVVAADVLELTTPR